MVLLEHRQYFRSQGICLVPCTATALSLLPLITNRVQCGKGGRPQKLVSVEMVDIFWSNAPFSWLSTKLGSEFYRCGREMLHLALNWWLLH